MILHQLVNDAERIIGEVPKPNYGPQTIKWVIELGTQGEFLGCTPTSGGGPKDRGITVIAPILSSKRTSGVAAQFLVDKTSYVLGLFIADDKSVKKDRSKEEYKAFTDLIKVAYDKTNSNELKALLNFYQWWQKCDCDQLSLGDIALTANDILTFRIKDKYVFDYKEVVTFWQQQDNSKVSIASTCQICGQQKSIPETLPVPIKGIPGGQAEMPFIGINSDTYESYGLSGAKNSTICAECAELYGKAINFMLSRDNVENHITLGPVVYIFWTREETGFSITNLLNHPQPDEVIGMINSYRNGKSESLAIKDTDFYMSAFSANSARVIVRDWLKTTLGDVKDSLAKWFDLIDIVDEYGVYGKPLGIFRLIAGLYRDKDVSKQMTPQVPQILVRAALHGDKIPLWFLIQAVNRCRSEQNVTHNRAALIKAVLISNNLNGGNSMTEIDRTDNRPAYLCGRLMATVEAIQKAAMPGINATLVDQFYGAASTAPATVFGNLMGNAQNHLSKLRKTRRGAYEGLQKSLEEVLSGLGKFPNTLNAQEQALFALGYYHQRSADRAARQQYITDSENKEEN
jgi:CRISPR-associated protein Csd1